MRFITIGVIEPIDGFEHRLRAEFETLKEKGMEAILRREKVGTSIFYHCAIEDDLFTYIAEMLADLVIDFWEPKLLKRIIRKYFYFDKNEQTAIFNFARRILNFSYGKDKSSQNLSKRKTIVIHKILDHLNNCNTIILDGFINFRLKEYIEHLEEVVDKAIDEYLMEKEYREFINLLRFFVDLHEPKEELVHILVKNGQFLLLDRDMKPVDKDKGIDTIAKENPDLSLDDIALSILINLAPRKIIIHGYTGLEKSEVISIIYNIFEGRVYFCNNCEICLASKPKQK
ncbi:putative sporulation protein YtxC [Thermosediminibacter oceani]|uniref:Sporulation protein YtxC n=1 Tax=Thermosediminibacter oceani (strain ATCC BAA-1034 / DSM 16646 / JW/IW-1228P) TaxID=555079 RepID=D9RXU0_THEOJ|nr:putative sporulation protein YtxC [Thermosediminibacter oceani]ADL08164.1 Sporulation protein YtxC [Thermosediminibacter oceani DSM 16646]